MTEFRVKVEPVDVDVVVLPRDRYEALLAAERKLEQPPKPNPLYGARVFDYMNAPVFTPVTRDAALRQAAREGFVHSDEFERERRRKLRALEALEQTRIDLLKAQNELADVRKRHAKASKHVGDRVRRIADLNATVDRLSRRATTAEKKVRESAQVEIRHIRTATASNPPKVVVQHGAETLYCTLESVDVNTGALPPVGLRHASNVSFT